MGEEATRIGFTGGQSTAGGFALGYVLDGDQHALPVVLITRENRAFQLNIDTAAGKGIVDARAVEMAVAVPELGQFVDMGVEHIVAENVMDVRGQSIEIGGLEQAQGFAVDLDDTKVRRTDAYALAILAEIGAQIHDALCAQALEMNPQSGIVFQP